MNRQLHTSHLPSKNEDLLQGGHRPVGPTSADFLIDIVQSIRINIFFQKPHHLHVLILKYIDNIF
jgi:hypothetical protein